MRGNGSTGAYCSAFVLDVTALFRPLVRSPQSNLVLLRAASCGNLHEVILQVTLNPVKDLRGQRVLASHITVLDLLHAGDL
jgi:hypothetical protein